MAMCFLMVCALLISPGHPSRFSCSSSKSRWSSPRSQSWLFTLASRWTRGTRKTAAPSPSGLSHQPFSTPQTLAKCLNLRIRSHSLLLGSRAHPRTGSHPADLHVGPLLVLAKALFSNARDRTSSPPTHPRLLLWSSSSRSLRTPQASLPMPSKPPPSRKIPFTHPPSGLCARRHTVC